MGTFVAVVLLGGLLAVLMKRREKKAAAALPPQQSSAPPVVRCPKCNSEQLSADKAGFGAGKAIGGALLLGPVGLAAGMVGKNKITLTCLNCGERWKPGQRR